MNKPLRKVGMAMLVMIVLLMANASYVQVIHGDEYAENPNNLRVLYNEYSRKRGTIGSQDGVELAGTEPSGDRFNYLRTYPYGPAYAQTLGYNSLRYGSAGLENALNEFLNGSDNRLFVRRLSDMITGREPQGGNVRLTLRPKVQEAAYQAMTDHGYTGSVVALDPKTGEILAMVSTPSYDPNKLASHDPNVQEEAWQQYTSNDAKPMLNRSISENYPPGSTFKLVVAAAALENGATADTKVTPDSQITLPDTTTTLENYAGARCPGNTLKDALAYSCNTAFAELAGKLGPQKLRETAQDFGIGMSDLQIPLPVVKSSLGPMESPASVYQSGIGQRDVRLTPLMDAMLSATVANDGVAMKPHLVSELLAPDMSTIEPRSQEELTGDPAMSASNAQVLTDMMIASEKHTSGSGKYPELKIASKTGTAEHGTQPKQTPPHAWYTAFAPHDDPKIAIAVVVESGGNRGLAATGGTVAAEIARTTMAAALGGG